MMQQAADARGMSQETRVIIRDSYLVTLNSYSDGVNYVC